MKFKIGFVSCAIVALHFAVNLGIMTGTSIKEAIKSCRFKYTWKKYEESRAAFQDKLKKTHTKRIEIFKKHRQPDSEDGHHLEICEEDLVSQPDEVVVDQAKI